MNRYFLISIIILLLVSCGNNEKPKNPNEKQSILQTSTGRTYEMLVVISEGTWESQLGDSIKSLFGQTAPWLFAPEAYFDISRVKPSGFGNLYKMYRNVLIVDVDGKYKKPKISLSRNVYAKPQKIVKLYGPDTKSTTKAFTENFKTILEQFNENEVIRVKSVYRGLHIKTISNKLKKRFGFDMVVPKGFYVAKQKDNFMWLRKETRHISEGIIIYTRPYTDTSMLNPDNILDYRNEITKNEIPGPVDSSYMKTSDVFPPYTKAVTFKDKYATLIRSWWDLEKYPMGGPFMSYTFVNEDATELITIDGYIYAPKKDKRDLLIHIESILKSFKFSKINNEEK